MSDSEYINMEQDDIVNDENIKDVKDKMELVKPPKSSSNNSTRNGYNNHVKESGVVINVDLKKSKGLSVVLRVRPLNSAEKSRKEISVVEFPGNGQIQLKSQYVNKTYSFNICFEPDATQDQIFADSGVQKLTELACEGYLSTCFVYGQTGSGKTFTMTGPTNEFLNRTSVNSSLFGIAPRSFFYLFDLMKKSQARYRVYASYLEIYNEQVKDLLNPHPLYPLNVRWNKKRCFYVDNLFLIECENAKQLLEVLQRGMKNRNFKATHPNEFSSRSHSIFSVMIDSEVVDSIDESIIYTRHGKLTFVDLAGSEKVKTDTDSHQNQLQETNNINRSLMVLGSCISSLSDSRKKNSYVPFRDSKLTKLLADSLSGNGFTIMIACVSPSNLSVTDTANTLRYAARALKIESNPYVKLDPHAKIIANLKREIYLLRQENLLLKSQGHIGMSQDEGKDETFNRSYVSLNESVKLPSERNILTSQDSLGSLVNDKLEMNDQQVPPNIYEMLQEYMVENETLRAKNLELIQTKEKLGRDFEIVMKENDQIQLEIEKYRSQQTKPHESKPMKSSSTKENSLISSNSFEYPSKPSTSNESPKRSWIPKPSKSTEMTKNRRNTKTSLKNMSLTDLSNSDLSNPNGSYAQLYSSRKISQQRSFGRRSFNDGTKLAPLKSRLETANTTELKYSK